MKKNKDFFYLQYNQIDWKNQEKTKINSFINKYIIENIISKHEGDSIAVFDIGLGIGFFIKMLYRAMVSKYKHVVIDGCEPSTVNFKYFVDKMPKIRKGDLMHSYDKKFLNVNTGMQFDFITAIYVFPHFVFDELGDTVQKIYSMLKNDGQFVLVLANEKYLKQKLDSEKDLFIESGMVNFDGKEYKEILHYSDIPKIGKVIDYNREERLYLDLFKKNRFVLKQKTDLNDNSFVCTLFVFEKTTDIGAGEF